MSTPEKPTKRDANEERITKLEVGQDALLKTMQGMDAYFKDPQGLKKQIETTLNDTLMNSLTAYDKTVQERFALRGETRLAVAQGGAATTENKSKGLLDGLDVRSLVKDVVDGLKGSGTPAKVTDPNYASYLTIRDEMMGKALGGLGRGLGNGISKEVQHLVKFD